MLEILVALVVLGLLLTSLAQATQFALLATGRQSRTTAAHADLDAVDRVLRFLIEQADTGSAADSPLFRGDSGSLEFTTEMPASIAMANHHVQVHLGVDAGHRLILRWVPTLHVVRTGPPPAPYETVLLTGVDRLTLSYWLSATTGAGWQASWNTQAPPPLVRFHIAFAAHSRMQWPDIVAATLRTQ